MLGSGNIYTSFLIFLHFVPGKGTALLSSGGAMQCLLALRGGGIKAKSGCQLVLPGARSKLLGKVYIFSPVRVVRHSAGQIC